MAVGDGRHDLFDPLFVQREDTVQNDNLPRQLLSHRTFECVFSRLVIRMMREIVTRLVIPQRLLAFPVELQKTLQLRLLIRVPFVLAQDVVEEFSDGVRDGKEEVHHAEHERGAGTANLKTKADAHLDLSAVPPLPVDGRQDI